MSPASRSPLGRALRVVVATPIVATATILAFMSPALAAEAPVGLGTATSFAVLAGSGITNTGPTTIVGDLGTFPTPTEIGFGSITLTGTDHADDAVTQSAKNALVTAYDDAAGRTPVTNVPVELGGTTLAPGVYTSPTFGLTGTLTLDAGGDPAAQFIFLAGSTLITEANSRVVLQNGASSCNVVWQVGSSATFKTGARFVGNVLALTSITAQTAATFEGRLLARNGAVTLDTNTITGAGCTIGASTAATTPTPILGGTTTAGSTDGTADGSGDGSGTTPADGTSTFGLDGFGPPVSLAITGGAANARIELALGLIAVGAIAAVLGVRVQRHPRSIG